MPEASRALEARPEPLVLRLLSDGLSVELPVTGHSMSPFIRPRDTLTLEPLGLRRVRLGDVVAFARAGDRLVIHRVVAAGPEAVQTRGDSATRPDEWIDRRRILARVSAVQRRNRPVSLGLGREARWIAWLSRTGVLSLVARLQRRLRGSRPAA